MLHVALTGNIASGKSTVAALLAEHGATIIDADRLARDAVAPGTPGLAAVVAAFGTSALTADGTLDRAALRRRVFGDPAARATLEAIVHPEVRHLRDAAERAARGRGDRVVVSDIPLLFEAGLADRFEGVILVDAPEAVRLERLMRDRGLSRSDAQAMIDAQWPATRKRSLATWVIDNDGPRAQLPARVADLWQALEARAAHTTRPPLPDDATAADTSP
ncbi:MAG: dephospho-CoA kinase [Gemmatimonas sp.]|jgi:dephospho-CoA kinase|uniref:dephospho-CoA kinase n=1 Tax=Gemmatimonas sp. TaxID=1962908 RepID=UPI00391F9217|nr:dephospho-CoA kinase [Gemmatimonadota bacterium]